MVGLLVTTPTVAPELKSALVLALEALLLMPAASDTFLFHSGGDGLAVCLRRAFGSGSLGCWALETDLSSLGLRTISAGLGPAC